jgi:hypothetical protein
LTFQSSHVHAQRNVRDVFDLVSQQLAGAVLERYPTVPSLDVKLLTGSLLHGLAIVATAWLDEHGGALNATSRTRWSQLLDHFLARQWAGLPAAETASASR